MEDINKISKYNSILKISEMIYLLTVDKYYLSETELETKDKYNEVLKQLIGDKKYSNIKDRLSIIYKKLGHEIFKNLCDGLSKDSLNKFINKLTEISNLTYSSNTIAFPSNPMMLLLIPIFSNKTIKNNNLINDNDKDDLNRFLNDTKNKVNSSISEDIIENEVYYSLMNDNNIGLENIQLSDSFVYEKIDKKESLSDYIKRTLGTEGLRHFIALIIGLEENFRQGYFYWNINEHLERLGYSKKNRSYDSSVKKLSFKIINLLTNLVFTIKRRAGEYEETRGIKLFHLSAFNIKYRRNNAYSHTYLIKAEDLWYKTTFRKADGKSVTYTKLLRKIATENHKNHNLSIYLVPMLSINWRMGSTTLYYKTKDLMELCNLPIDNKYRLEKLRKLEIELNYMKERNYIQDWKCNDEHILPSEMENSFNTILSISAPDWLISELKLLDYDINKIE